MPIMEHPVKQDRHTAPHIARIMLSGFDTHYCTLRDLSRKAKSLFEAGDWPAIQKIARERLPSYVRCADDTAGLLKELHAAEELDSDTWKSIKLHFIGELLEHKQPELAETFFNSVCSRLRQRTYFRNDAIFTRPAVSTEHIPSAPPVYSCYYPTRHGLRRTIKKIITDFEWNPPFENLDRDVGHVLRTVKKFLSGWPRAEPNAQIQVLYSAFYRNKAAYVFGKIINGTTEIPFAIPVLHNRAGMLVLDTILLETWRIAVLFSLSRAYFMVDMEVPSGYVQFLLGMLPNKPRSEIYTMLGLGRQGKTMFFRDLKEHLRHSEDRFIIAPGVRGMVMMVFTLPSYPYVFKVIRDQFAATKEVDHETVRAKYLLVKQVDRVGRMADTLEFSYVALPRQRFSEDLLTELRTYVPSQLEEDGENLVIRHLYIERRMTPLNLYLESANQEQLEGAVLDYGNAIRELACSNIFPGDMLWKNFGVTSYNRVVFYDYDEIEYMTDCRFRKIPEAPYPELEMSSEAWYPVSKNDVFPEEFASFLLGSPAIRAAFLKHHAQLLTPEFWLSAQESIRAGQIEDFFPYDENLRFCKVFGKKQAR